MDSEALILDLQDREHYFRDGRGDKLTAGLFLAARAKIEVQANTIEALQADNARLREALRVYAGPMEWTQEGGWGMFPVWADGYPGGVYLDDNTLDFGEAARAALQETGQ